MTTRELIQARYSRIRQDMHERDLILDGVVPTEEVPESTWDADEAYLAKMRKGRSFTYTRMTIGETVEESVSLGTVAYWTEVLNDPCCQEEGETVDEIREATEAEVVEFVMGSGIERAQDDDLEFQRGWDAAKEGQPLF